MPVYQNFAGSREVPRIFAQRIRLKGEKYKLCEEEPCQSIDLIAA